MAAACAVGATATAAAGSSRGRRGSLITRVLLRCDASVAVDHATTRPLVHRSTGGRNGRARMEAAYSRWAWLAGGRAATAQRAGRRPIGTTRASGSISQQILRGSPRRRASRTIFMSRRGKRSRRSCVGTRRQRWGRSWGTVCLIGSAPSTRWDDPAGGAVVI